MKRSSLHYQFLTKGMFSTKENSLPTSICGYFWFFIFKLVITSIAFLTTSLAIIGAILCLAQGIDVINLDHLMGASKLVNLFVLTSVILGFFTWVAISLFVLMVTVGLLYGLLYYTWDSTGSALLGKYIKAKKDKVCPSIKWED